MILYSPFYDFDTWSVYKRIQEKIPKTTNSLEGVAHGI